MRRQILITGLGVVSPFGVGVEAYWDGLCHTEKRPVSSRDLAAVRMRHRQVYEVPSLEGCGRTARDFALRAAEMALEDANLREQAADGIVGVSLGNAMGDHVVERANQDGATNNSEGFAFRVADAVASAFALAGPVISISTACSAGLYSISLAADLIRMGAADVMLVGGAEAVSRVALACFNRLGALDPECCRPFDRDRKGTVMGEGAAILILESQDHAQRRGWDRSYGEIEGWGWSCDGYHVTIPEPSGRMAAQAAFAALADAGLSPGAIDCVLAHGTGTAQNDVVESRVMTEVLGPRAATVPVCGLKGKLGHSGGAAGAFQCLTAALVLHKGLLPPTGNLSSIDPACLLYLPFDTIPANGFQHVLMNSYAFGGNNISLIVGRVHS